MSNALDKLRSKLQAQELAEQLARVQRHLLVQQHTMRLQERSAQLLLGKLLALHERLAAFAPRPPPPPSTVKCEARQSVERAEDKAQREATDINTNSIPQQVANTSSVEATHVEADFVWSEAGSEVFWPAMWSDDKIATLTAQIPPYVWALRPEQLRLCVEQRLHRMQDYHSDQINRDCTNVSQDEDNDIDIRNDACAAAAALLALLTPQLTSLYVVLTCVPLVEVDSSQIAVAVTAAREAEERVGDVQHKWQVYWVRIMYAVLHEATLHLRHFFFALSAQQPPPFSEACGTGPHEQRLSMTERAVQQAAFDAAACAEAVRRIVQTPATYSALLRSVTVPSTEECTRADTILSVAPSVTSCDAVSLSLPPALFSTTDVDEAFGFLRDLCGA